MESTWLNNWWCISDLNINLAAATDSTNLHFLRPSVFLFPPPHPYPLSQPHPTPFPFIFLPRRQVAKHLLSHCNCFRLPLFVSVQSLCFPDAIFSAFSFSLPTAACRLSFGLSGSFARPEKRKTLSWAAAYTGVWFFFFVFLQPVSGSPLTFL